MFSYIFLSLYHILSSPYHFDILQPCYSCWWLGKTTDPSPTLTSWCLIGRAQFWGYKPRIWWGYLLGNIRNLKPAIWVYFILFLIYLMGHGCVLKMSYIKQITLLRVIPTLAYYSDILSDILWHVFGSRCPPQHPELAIWCSGPGVTHCIRSRGGGGGGGTSCTFVYLNLEVRKKGLLNRDNEDKLWIWGYIFRQTHIYWDRNGVSMRNHMTLKGSSRNLNGSVYPHMASWVEKFIKNQVFLGCHIFQHTNLLVSLTE